jgi:AcrR family transcriptional regulator
VVTQARTRLARRAVVDAARMLFLDRGYEAPTIEAISELSDGPHATVYRLFSSKRGILKALLAVSIVGDDEALAMADRPPVPSLLANPHPKNQLEGFVAIAAPINSRTAAIYRILVSAAASDPDAAALLRELTRQRQEGQRRIARSLARARALRPVIVVTVPLCRAPGHLRHPAGRQPTVPGHREQVAYRRRTRSDRRPNCRVPTIFPTLGRGGCA